MRNTPTVPVTPENKKRRASKLKRNKGQGAIEKAKSNDIDWCQSKDPLFKIKGKKRHNLIKK